MKHIIQGLAGVLVATIVSGPALAHVKVTPAQVGIGQELIFNVSVPNEQQVPVASVKLDIPSGVTNVVPTEKPGWTITTTKSGDNVSLITWIGSMPVGQRDDFTFSAQAPARASELDWKAYQTYGDGSVIHWDLKPTGSDDSTGTAGPYSVTQVANDLVPKSSLNTPNTKANLGIGLGMVALIIAGFSLFRRRY